MLFDLLDTDNIASFNTKLAQVIGLTGAVYVNQLITIQNKAQRKSKIDEDGYFTLNRSYILSKTTLTKSQQESLDNELIKLEILSKKDNKLKLDVNVISSIICQDDKLLTADLRKITKANKVDSKEIRRERTIQALKNCITIKDPELTPALEEWVEVCLGETKMNKVTVQKFINDLNNVTQGDLDYALALVRIAAANCYSTLAWAVNKYESEKSVQIKMTQSNVRSITNTNDKLTEVEF